MAFSIKNEEADRLARQLAAATGESLTEAVIRALRERLGRQQLPAKRSRAGTELALLARKLRKLPVRDKRSAEEILGYDQNGLPG
jgi:antitoxin VapB